MSQPTPNTTTTPHRRTPHCTSTTHDLQCGHTVRTNSPLCTPACASPSWGPKHGLRLRCPRCHRRHAEIYLLNHLNVLATLRATLRATLTDMNSEAAQDTLEAHELRLSRAVPPRIWRRYLRVGEARFRAEVVAQMRAEELQAREDNQGWERMGGMEDVMARFVDTLTRVRGRAAEVPQWVAWWMFVAALRRLLALHGMAQMAQMLPAEGLAEVVGPMETARRYFLAAERWLTRGEAAGYIRVAGEMARVYGRHAVELQFYCEWEEARRAGEDGPVVDEIDEGIAERTAVMTGTYGADMDALELAYRRRVRPERGLALGESNWDHYQADDGAGEYFRMYLAERNSANRSVASEQPTDPHSDDSEYGDDDDHIYSEDMDTLPSAIGDYLGRDEERNSGSDGDNIWDNFTEAFHDDHEGSNDVAGRDADHVADQNAEQGPSQSNATTSNETPNPPPDADTEMRSALRDLVNLFLGSIPHSDEDRHAYHTAVGGLTNTYSNHREAVTNLHTQFEAHVATAATEQEHERLIEDYERSRDMMVRDFSMEANQLVVRYRAWVEREESGEGE